MAEYTYTQAANTPLVNEELATASFASVVDGVKSEPNGADLDLVIVTTQDLTTGEQTELDALMAAHDPNGLTMRQRIVGARTFGVNLIDSYQAQMISEGVVQAGKAHELAAKLGDSLVMAQAGNLYALDTELATIVPTTTFLEQARIDEMRNAVRSYLGLPPL